MLENNSDSNSYIAVAVDHRSKRMQTQSLCKFIYPQEAASLGISKTLGRYGADFAELRAWEYSLLHKTENLQAILHYRRVFIFPLDHQNSSLFIQSKTWEGNHLYFWNWAFTPELGWSRDSFSKLELAKTYLPFEIDNTIFGEKNNYDQFIKSHPKAILEVLENTWEDSQKFTEFLKNTTKTTPYNMIIASHEVRMRAFEWLIPILNRMEPHLVSLSKDTYQKRWPGFLAERLFTYYWNVICNENIVRVEIGRLDNSLEVSNYISSKSKHTAMFASDKNYLLPTLASMEIYCSRGFTSANFLVLYTEWDGALGEKADYISSLQELYPQHEFHIIKLEKSIEEIDFKDSRTWAKATYLRFATLLMCGDPVSYWFDGDTIPMGNIDEISQSLQENKLVAMAPDVFLLKRRLQHIWDSRFKSETWAQYYDRILPIEKYPILYQAGIIVFANNQLRETLYLSHLIKLSMTTEFPGAVDQDVTNQVLLDQISLLPLEFNYVNHVSEDVKKNIEIVSAESRVQIENWLKISNPKIIHFTGENQPKPFKSASGIRLGFQYLVAINSTVAGQIMLQQAHAIGSMQPLMKIEMERAIYVKFKKKIFNFSQRIYFKLPMHLRSSRKLVALRVTICNWLDR